MLWTSTTSSTTVRERPRGSHNAMHEQSPIHNLTPVLLLRTLSPRGVDSGSIAAVERHVLCHHEWDTSCDGDDIAKSFQLFRAYRDAGLRAHSWV